MTSSVASMMSSVCINGMLIPGNLTDYGLNTSLADTCSNPGAAPGGGHLGGQSAGVEDFVIVVIYGLICIIGLVGNALVVFVISCYTKMKTVTNLYILNLSISDFLFLLGMPMIMTTMLIKSWVFGLVMCKIFFLLNCINMFTGAFTLMVISGDRFLAVCYPIVSIRYRTLHYATLAILLIWVVSFLVMLPVFLYAQIFEHPLSPGVYSCTIQWPTIAQGISPEKAYFCYIMVMGFILPVTIIVVLYTLLLIQLRSTVPHVKSTEKKHSHHKVTKLVTTIIGIYIICWLPYWAFQIHLILLNLQITHWKVYMFLVFTILSYANSMINPILYAFINKNFRESFISAFGCAANPILGGRRSSEFNNVADNNSVVGGTRTKRLRSEAHTEYEFTTFTTLNGSSAVSTHCGEDV